MVAQPKKTAKVDRKQEGGEPIFTPPEKELPEEEEDEEDDLDEEEAGSPEEEDNRRIVLEAAKALRGESDDPQMAIDEFLETFGREKLEQLRTVVADEEPEEEGAESPAQMAAGGRLVEGPGRGLDDRIKAAAGEQPVLLSDGEFVIPADVVSHLGDGSTKAGVRVLESMMARVRHAKTGSKKQAGKLDRKVLPV